MINFIIRKEFVTKNLVALYQEMADLTLRECQCCRSPYSCCSQEYCDETIRYALERWNVMLEPTGHAKLPLMGEKGCIAAPHLRSMCTLHTCEVNSMGCKRGDPCWTEKYFLLRGRIEELEWSLEELNK